MKPQRHFQEELDRLKSLLVRMAGLAEEAVRLAVEALYDAADDDTATGGPDLTRKIYPVIMTATADGTRRLTDEEAAAVAEAVVAGRMENPGG